MAQFADEYTSEQDSYRAWQQEQAHKAAQAEAAARARAQEQAQATARAVVTERERAAVQARAAEQARARAAAQALAARRARAEEQARETTSAETAARERAAVQARADEQARARAAAQAEAVARARVQEQTEATARAQATERERAAVQARADEQARAQVAAQAEAVARARAEEEAREAARAQVAERERAVVGARAAEPGPPPRGTPAYDAYLQEMLNARTQGIASGTGSISEPGEPARRTGPKEPTLAELLRDGFVPGSGARPAVKVADDSSRVGPPPADTPEYYAYLQAMIDRTPQGIAPGVGSFSEPGEPARRGGAREPTLAELLRDGFTPGSGARSVPGSPREPRAPSIADLSEQERRRLRNMEREPVSGPGARMFEVTPDEESFWAAISPDEFISEELIEIHRRGEFNDEDVVIMEEYSPEAGQRAELIAYYDKQGLRGKNDVDALRAGAALPEGSDDLADFADWLGRELGEAHRPTLPEMGHDLLDEPSEFVFGAIVSGLEAAGEEGVDALARFQGELAEWPELSRQEQFERLHQSYLGGFVSWNPLNPMNMIMPGMPFDTFGALEGLAGNREYQGRDHFLLRQLPDDLRDPLGELVEDATQPEILVPVMIAVVGGVALASLAAPVAVAVAATLALTTVSTGVGMLITDLRKDDPASLRILEALLERANGLLNDIDPDGEIRRLLSSPIAASPGTGTTRQ